MSRMALRILDCGIIVFLFLQISSGYTQRRSSQQTPISSLLKNFQQYQQKKSIAIAWAIQQSWPVRSERGDRRIFELQYLRHNGTPAYYLTNNSNAAKTVSTDKLWPGGASGLNLSGSGITLGIWDGGRVRTTHQEFGGRVIQQDGVTSLSSHATHVAGTMVAQGVNPEAHGMSFQASLEAYDFNMDDPEMAAASASGLMISNHSYGFIQGWIFNFFKDSRWVWFGDSAIDSEEDYLFGFYNDDARIWDEIAFRAPFYLIVKAAGNERSDFGPLPGAEHWDFEGGIQVLRADTHGPDGGNAGYDCLTMRGVCKNILTVGAVNDILAGYNRPADVLISGFSSWGPADDGRIKPDIVANGVGLFSPTDGSDMDYTIFSGTSMAAPNASGTLGLLVQHYRATHGEADMRAATLKALVIHTAEEAGDLPGPDYSFGWGLLNAAAAASVIIQDTVSRVATIAERSLSNGETHTFQVTSANGVPLRATIVWNDPPGAPVAPALDPPDKMLVNDLDLRVSSSNTTFTPWILDPANPAAPAGTGDNNTDNVEQVHIFSPTAELYTITVTHKGALAGGFQDYSLILTGITNGLRDSGVVSATAVCPTSSLQKCPLTISVAVDMTETLPAELLESFTGRLNWDPTVLNFTQHSGLLAGFSGIINSSKSESGELPFEGTNITGVGGTITLFDATFEVIGSANETSSAKLNFSTLVSAQTSNDLLPILAIDDCDFMVTAPGILGDANGDGDVNSTDALIILSFDASLPVPPAIRNRINQGFADVNSDNSTNSTDALIILSFDVSIPVPFQLGEPFCE